MSYDRRSDSSAEDPYRRREERDRFVDWTTATAEKVRVFAPTLYMARDLYRLFRWTRNVIGRR